MVISEIKGIMNSLSVWMERKKKTEMNINKPKIERIKQNLETHFWDLNHSHPGILGGSQWVAHPLPSEAGGVQLRFAEKVRGAGTGLVSVVI
ncbi:hypothetical protein SLEP1_g17380 [Rubroshorea leprosula]|uniref:Uncharacterized protein n=1 Tax=Rubroshorea leprosula TaxID=152421 RepID=A0AAV5J347_9ROSI|nr:hypothetical protein SLEP1_g17380 [Rubroshorea leprosula]